MSREDERITALPPDDERSVGPDPDGPDPATVVVLERRDDPEVPTEDAVEQQTGLRGVGSDERPGWEVDPAEAADRTVPLDEEEYR